MESKEESSGSQVEGRASKVTVELPADFGSARVGEARSCAPATLDLRVKLRESLGLPLGFLAGAGHQPILWHAGILAKFVAASATARQFGPGAHWVHFLSDQEALDPLRIDLPTRDSGGNLQRSSLRLATPTGSLAGDAVACARPAQEPRIPDGDGAASPAALRVLEAFCSELGRARGEPSAAMQVARATEVCAARWITPSFAIISSQRLLGCAEASPIVRKILDAPEECAKRFNAALALDRHAARPLRENGLCSEVPMWGIDRQGRRERLDATEARRRIEVGLPILPRAFLASGLMRIICDLFFHGTGGARYERVGGQWWREFLGIELPQFGCATATLLPSATDLGINSELPAQAGISWREAWWDPTRLDDPPARSRMIEPIRAAHLQRIADAPRCSKGRRAAYRALCNHIESLRGQRHAQLALIAADETRTQLIRGQIALTQDRTWPFMLARQDALDAMAATITARITRASPALGGADPVGTYAHRDSKRAL